MNREILIIGGTGFIGTKVCEEFLRIGDKVNVLHRKLSEGFPKHLNLIHMLGGRGNPPAELKKRSFDVVIDTCGFKPTDFSILDSIHTQHYIFISSVAVFSRNTLPFANEDAPKIDEDNLDLSGDYSHLDKHQRYGILKLECEKYIKLRSENFSIIRPSIVLGRNDNTGRLEKLRNLPKIDAPIPFHSERKFQFIDVADLASLIIRVAEQLPGDDYNLVGPSLSWQEFVDTFSKIFQLKSHLVAEHGADFPFWDEYPNAGIRSLTSKHPWISQYKFTNLTESLLQFELNYKLTYK